MAGVVLQDRADFRLSLFTEFGTCCRNIFQKFAQTSLCDKFMLSRLVRLADEVIDLAIELPRNTNGYHDIFTLREVDLLYEFSTRMRELVEVLKVISNRLRTANEHENLYGNLFRIAKTRSRLIVDFCDEQINRLNIGPQQAVP